MIGSGRSDSPYGLHCRSAKLRIQAQMTHGTPRCHEEQCSRFKNEGPARTAIRTGPHSERSMSGGFGRPATGRAHLTSTTAERRPTSGQLPDSRILRLPQSSTGPPEELESTDPDPASSSWAPCDYCSSQLNSLPGLLPACLMARLTPRYPAETSGAGGSRVAPYPTALDPGRRTLSPRYQRVAVK